MPIKERIKNKLTRYLADKYVNTARALAAKRKKPQAPEELYPDGAEGYTRAAGEWAGRAGGALIAEAEEGTRGDIEHIAFMLKAYHLKRRPRTRERRAPVKKLKGAPELEWLITRLGAQIAQEKSDAAGIGTAFFNGWYGALKRLNQWAAQKAEDLKAEIKDRATADINDWESRSGEYGR